MDNQPPTNQPPQNPQPTPSPVPSPVSSQPTTPVVQPTVITPTNVTVPAESPNTPAQPVVQAVGVVVAPSSANEPVAVNNISAPTPVITNTPNNPAVTQPPTEVLVGSQLEKAEMKRKSRHQLLLIPLILLVILGAASFGLMQTGILSFGKMKTITYDNGLGEKFKFKFYKNYSKKNVATALGSSTGTTVNTVNSKLEEIVSKEGINGKYPLSIFIESDKASKEPISKKEKAAIDSSDCSKVGTVTKAFKINIISINKNVQVCSFRQGDKDFAYTAIFKSGDKGYVVYISQDIDFKQLASSAQAARDGLAKVGLSDYQDDIKTILSSIKIVN